MNLVEYAQRIRDRIDKGWCREVSARDKYRKPVPPESPRAVKFCILGAVMAEGEHLELRFTSRFYEWLGTTGKFQRGLLSVSDWNDSQPSKKAVVKALDSFIASLEGK